MMAAVRTSPRVEGSHGSGTNGVVVTCGTDRGVVVHVDSEVVDGTTYLCLG